MEEFEVLLDALKLNAFEWAKHIVLAVVIFLDWNARGEGHDARFYKGAQS